MNKIFLVLFLTCTAVFAQEVRYKETKVETEDLIISTIDAISYKDISKFKLRITNKTGDFIVFRIKESKFQIIGKEISPVEKRLVIEPNETVSKVIDIRGDKYYEAKNFKFVLNGLYKVSAKGNLLDAPDFKLPVAQNDFKTGNFNCTVDKIKKETDQTIVRFRCSYTGDKIGIVNPAKASVKMPDGNEYANAKTNEKSFILMQGEEENFALIWNKITGGKEMDMQFAQMNIRWHNVFAEALPQKINQQIISFIDVNDPDAVSTQQTDVFSKAVEEKKQEPVKQEEQQAQYRGGGDPLKGLNVNKATGMQVGNYYALIIGVDKYNGTWQPLKNAVHDAKAVETLLREEYKFDFFKTLYNEQATRKNIITQLEWLAANAKEKDNVLIYYSGHGEYKQQLNKGFWVPVDAQTTSTSDYISNNDIQTFLSGIKSKHTLLVSDACFSGDIFRGNTVSVPFENSERYYREVHNLNSRQALTSGGIEPVMDGGREGHSVFAYYFLKSLINNQEKYYDASQLYNTIKIPVTNNSEQSPLFQSIKNTGDEGGQFIFIKK